MVSVIRDSFVWYLKQYEGYPPVGTYLGVSQARHFRQNKPGIGLRLGWGQAFGALMGRSSALFTRK